MKAIGRNLIVNMPKQGVSQTKGGLFLAEKQREDIRYAEGVVISVGNEIDGIKEKIENLEEILDKLYDNLENKPPLEKHTEPN